MPKKEAAKGGEVDEPAEKDQSVQVIGRLYDKYKAQLAIARLTQSNDALKSETQVLDGAGLSG